jgi:hypothetical protein
MKSINKIKEYLSLELIIVIFTGFALLLCTVKIALNSHEKENIYLMENNEYNVVTNYNNMFECLKDNNKSEKSNLFKNETKTTYKNNDSCEYIYSAALNIHKTYGNKNKTIESIAILKSKNNLKYYPLYLNEENKLVYFFNERYFENENLNSDTIRKYNDKILAKKSKTSLLAIK